MMEAPDNKEIGFVTDVKHYLFSVEGLPSVRINDIIQDTNGHKAIIRSLNGSSVTALSLSKNRARPGDTYIYTGEDFMISCGDHLFGRVIDALGNPVDGGAEFTGEKNVSFEMEVDAPGIENRVEIHEQLFTGITLVDTLVPVAKGQRQLIFGPMHSGIPSFLTETVLNQRGTETISIYVALGKPINNLREITDKILHEDSKAIVIAAQSDEPTPLIAIAPSVAYLIADYFRSRGRDVLVILDDLDAHAKYLREIALLEKRLPSTESYPGDIFYQHAHLMERSGHYDKGLGGGSVTTFPVIKTSLKNFSDLIPTNLMACTDGHLAFHADLYAQGVYPSISFEESVTRVGRHAQKLLQKQLMSHVQMRLAQYKQQKEYSQFSAQMSEDAKTLINQGEIIEELLRQTPYKGVDPRAQVIMLSLAFTPFFSEKNVGFVHTHKERLIQAIVEEEIFEQVREKALSDIEYTAFIAELQDMREVFETICQY